MAAGLPLTEGGKGTAQVSVPDITLSSLKAQQQTASSAVLQPLVTLFGSPSGLKKDMQATAVMVNEWVLSFDSPLDSLSLKPTAKLEVINRGKKVRVLYNESQANYMVLQHVFGDLVSVVQDSASGRAIGMSSQEGTSRASSNGGSTVVEDWQMLD